jgi:hypothetical protein
MFWMDRWRAISARIDGLVSAGDLMASALRVNSSDVYSVVRKSIAPTLQAINADLRIFQRDCGAVLPETASASLTRFIDANWAATAGEATVDVHVVVPFSVFRSEFEFLLSDSEASARSQTELAFEHLIRTLAVDVDVRRRWATAANEHETKCEKLGAVHLLSHGIWAFKVSAAGAATDLVFGEPLADRSDIVRRTARALVLTEWKVVQDVGDAPKKAEEARRQADRYSDGILRDLALNKTRYVVLVSKVTFDPPIDVVDSGVTYTHFVLGLDGATPSKVARQRGAA